jgi:cellulose synthase/poly-beta-1,6-N-acetylglucosamine synthase-like glycosyltransferase
MLQDMDLSLRCYLRGWGGIYLPHVDNDNEVPSTLSSYKTQQFRQAWAHLEAAIMVDCKPEQAYSLHAPPLYVVWS